MPEEEKKVRRPRESKKHDFMIQVNVRFTITAADKLMVQAMVTQAINKLRFPGCLGREISFVNVKELIASTARSGSGLDLMTDIRQ